MPITEEHEKLIVHIDKQVNKILSEGGDNKTLLMSLAESMNDLKRVMDAATGDELDLYGERYSGFYYFMKLLEELALDISKGRIAVAK